MKKMDENGTKLLIVLKGNKYYSLVSIGDIQRAIIRGKELSEPVSRILRPENKVRYARKEDGIGTIRQTMMKYRTEFMPVIDRDQNVVEIIFWEDIIDYDRLQGKKKIPLPVVIMAGGKGTRMKPITNIIPKALLPLGEKTILEHIVDRFAETGVDRFYLSVNYKHELIRQYVKGLHYPGISFEYIQEKEPLGTAGSLYLVRESVRCPVFVTNCDIIIEQDYRDIYEYHKNNHNEITIVAAIKHYPVPYGILKTGSNGILEDIVEKQGITLKVNTGMYILEHSALEEIPDNRYLDITTLINRIRKEDRKIGVFPVTEESWLDIGRWSEYQNTLNKFGSTTDV